MMSQSCTLATIPQDPYLRLLEFKYFCNLENKILILKNYIDKLSMGSYLEYPAEKTSAIYIYIRIIYI